MKNVLYIEDNLVNIKIMQAFFSQQSWSLTLKIARSAEEGLEMIRQQTPAIILTDIHLPDMDGEQIAKLIKNDPKLKHIPIIAVTAMALQDEIDRAEVLFDSYLTKPINLIELKKILIQFTE